MNLDKHVRKNQVRTLPKLYSYNEAKILPYVFLALIFFALMVPLMLKPEIDIYDARDEEHFHYPTILTFLEQFPHLDLVNYRSSTTPLYHIILTLAALIFSSDIVQLRLINSAISLFCLLVVYRYLSARGNTLKGLYFAIIFMLSPYFIGPAIRLSTDNAALLFAFLSIFTIDIRIPSNKSFLLTNVLIFCTTLIRQIYAWLIGAYLLFNLHRYKFKQPVTSLIQVLLPALIPIAGLAFFLFLWKGLAPPRFSAHSVQRLNWDAPVFIVSLIGLYGSLFYFWLFKMFEENRGKFFSLILLVGLAIGFLLLHPVSNEYPVVDNPLHIDRGGSLWLVASHLPNLLSSSVVFWTLFPIGLICLYVMARHLISKREYLMIVCFLLWLTASVINTKTYQKYYEPFILFSLGYVMTSSKTKEKWYFWIGPTILIVGFMGITLERFF